MNSVRSSRAACPVANWYGAVFRTRTFGASATSTLLPKVAQLLLQSLVKSSKEPQGQCFSLAPGVGFEDSSVPKRGAGFLNTPETKGKILAQDQFFSFAPGVGFPPRPRFRSDFVVLGSAESCASSDSSALAFASRPASAGLKARLASARSNPIRLQKPRKNYRVLPADCYAQGVSGRVTLQFFLCSRGGIRTHDQLVTLIL